jgi:hypothetical protein
VALNVTTPPSIEHTELVVESMVRATGNPDVEVAIGV